MNTPVCGPTLLDPDCFIIATVYSHNGYAGGLSAAVRYATDIDSYPTLNNRSKRPKGLG
jgi:hypothetical protein